jgi:hypothetical protein
MKYIKLFENFSKNKAFVKYGLDQYKIKNYTINDDLDSISNVNGTIFCDDNIDTSKFEGYCKEIKKF